MGNGFYIGDGLHFLMVFILLTVAIVRGTWGTARRAPTYPMAGWFITGNFGDGFHSLMVFILMAVAIVRGTWGTARRAPTYPMA